MKCVLYIFGLTAGLSLATVASATVTYTFATSDTQVAQGSTYCATFSTPSSCSGKQTVTVYGEQTNGNPDTTFSSSSSTLNGLFTVTDSPNNFGTGIAPYDPREGTGGSFSSQDGINHASASAKSRLIPVTSESSWTSG